MGDRADDTRQLRARIEAQVAARRKGAIPSRERVGRRHAAPSGGAAEPSPTPLNGAAHLADRTPVWLPGVHRIAVGEPAGHHGPAVPPDRQAGSANGTVTGSVDGANVTGTARRGAGHARRALAGRLVLFTVLVAVVVVLLRSFVIASYYIPSGSMEPTLHGCPGCNNDHVLVDKLSYKLHAVHRGDVVVFHRPPGLASAEPVLIKRVIGLPGDTLADRDGTLYVNGDQLVEPYVDPVCRGGTLRFATDGVTVPAGEVYVLGDNRCDSLDSRSFGPVTESSIIGRAFMIIWPLSRLHYL